MTPTPPSVNGTTTTSHLSNPQTPPLTPTTPATLEDVAKAVAFIGSLLYILGLLVVNIYLGQWYVIDYSLLSARFIAAGVVFVMFTIGVALLPLVAVLKLSEVVQDGIEKQVISRVSRYPRLRASLKFLPGLLSIGTLMYIVYVIHGWLTLLVEHSRQFRIPLATDASPAFEAFWIYLLAFATSMCVFDVRTASWGKPLRILGRVSIPMFILLAYLTFFARGIYGGLPFDVGGGSPRPTRLLVNADKLASATQLGISFEPNTNLTTSVLVLFEGTDLYLLRLDDGTTVQITKDLIEGSQVREVAPTGTP